VKKLLGLSKKIRRKQVSEDNLNPIRAIGVVTTPGMIDDDVLEKLRDVPALLLGVPRPRYRGRRRSACRTPTHGDRWSDDPIGGDPKPDAALGTDGRLVVVACVLLGEQANMSPCLLARNRIDNVASYFSPVMLVVFRRQFRHHHGEPGSI
jgi:hypothetical protein